MKTILMFAGLLAFGLLTPVETATAQPTALSNPKPCNYTRCLGSCVKNRIMRNCHQYCRRCT